VWTHVSHPVEKNLQGKTVSVELQIQSEIESGNDALFYVRDLSFVTEAETSTEVEFGPSYGLPALARSGLFASSRPLVLFSAEYKLAIEVVNWLRLLGVNYDSVVQRNQENILSSEPDMKVVGSYVLDSADFTYGNIGDREVVLVVAANEEEAQALSALLPDPGPSQKRYAVFDGAFTADIIRSPVPDRSIREAGLRHAVVRVRRFGLRAIWRALCYTPPANWPGLLRHCWRGQDSGTEES